MEGTVLITGASSGIGMETARLFQSKNWRVAATMRSPESATDLQKIADLKCYRLDVTEPDSIREAIAAAAEDLGQIDVVVNNAGYGLLGPFEAASEEELRRQFETNVFGVMNVCREIIPYFRQQRRGTIVNVTSMAGRMAFPFSSLYNASKFAVEGFTESLQYELSPFGIRVKLIEPGPIKTDFYDRSRSVAKKEGLTIYDHRVEPFLRFMDRGGAEAPDGTIVAQAIYDSVTDGSSRLRYKVNTKGLLAIKSILPERAFFALVRKIFLK